MRNILARDNEREASSSIYAAHKATPTISLFLESTKFMSTENRPLLRSRLRSPYDSRKIMIEIENREATSLSRTHFVRFPRPLIYLFLINGPTLIFELIRSHHERMWECKWDSSQGFAGGLLGCLYFDQTIKDCLQTAMYFWLATIITQIQRFTFSV